MNKFKVWHNTEKRWLEHGYEACQEEVALTADGEFVHVINRHSEIEMTYKVGEDVTVCDGLPISDVNGEQLYKNDAIEVTHPDADKPERYKIVWGGGYYPAFDVSPPWPGEANAFYEMICGDGYEIKRLGSALEHPELLEGVE